MFQSSLSGLSSACSARRARSSPRIYFSKGRGASCTSRYSFSRRAADNVIATIVNIGESRRNNGSLFPEVTKQSHDIRVFPAKPSSSIRQMLLRRHISKSRWQCECFQATSIGKSMAKSSCRAALRALSRGRLVSARRRAPEQIFAASIAHQSAPVSRWARTSTQAAASVENIKSDLFNGRRSPPEPAPHDGRLSIFSCQQNFYAVHAPKRWVARPGYQYRS